MISSQTSLFTDERQFETKTCELGIDALCERVFTVSPLVLVGSKDTDGTYDLAPKHMAMPLGWGDRYCFVCTPRHRTYGNIERHGAFTVSFPRYFQVVQASLAATRRDDDGTKPTLAALPTFPAGVVDGVLVHGCYLFLECELDRFVDLDDASLVIGRIVAASAVEDAIRDPDRDDAELLRHVSPLAYLSPSRFAAAGDSQSFPFPSSFSR
jgi:flavin reductase (DIM6/NTAB) family NADH-FMN oxidoreductase RutF